MNAHSPPINVWSDWFIVREMGDELLVYDLRTQKVTSLNGFAAKVWQAWEAGLYATDIATKLRDKGTSVDDEGAIDLALNMLHAAHLIPALPVPTTSFRRWKDRRAFLGKFFSSGASAGAAAAATALQAPTVVTILAPTPAEAASACTTSAQCAPPTPVCSGGACVAGCTSDSSCSLGSFCNTTTGNCQSGCTSNANCGGGTPYCVSGSCVTCTSNAQCSGSTPICTLNQCVGCTSDGQCGSGKYCSGGRCLTGCGSDAGCNPPRPYCITGTHTCVACLSSSNCANPTPICTSGNCVGCTSSAQCSAGKQCQSGSCVTAAGGCTSDSQCSGVKPYCKTATSTCEQCLIDGNCEDPFYPYCINNECTDGF